MKKTKEKTKNNKKYDICELNDLLNISDKQYEDKIINILDKKYKDKIIGSDDKCNILFHKYYSNDLEESIIYYEKKKKVYEIKIKKFNEQLKIIKKILNNFKNEYIKKNNKPFTKDL